MTCPKLPRTQVALLALGGLLLVLTHFWLILPLSRNGDAAVYAEQIERRIFDLRTTHIGYILLGIGADALLPFGVERNLNLMGLIFAAIGAMSLAAIAKKLGFTWFMAAFAPILSFALEPRLRDAVLAEVDGVACAFTLLALGFWLYGRRFVAGIGFGIAMLVTPLTALNLPLFLFTLSNSDTEQDWSARFKSIGLFTSASLITYLPFVLIFWRDYWYGGRGILHAPSQAWDLATQLDRSLRFYVSASGPILALYITGFLIALGQRNRLAYGTALSIIGATVFGERFLDVPVQLPLACILCVFAVTLAAKIRQRKYGVLLLTAAWVFTAIPNYQVVAREVSQHERKRAIYLEMAKQTPRVLLVGVSDSWDEGLPFERVVYGKTKLGLGLDWRQFNRSSRVIARTRQDHAVWLLTNPPPDAMLAFQTDWHRETRVVLGRKYEVWQTNAVR